GGPRFQAMAGAVDHLSRACGYGAPILGKLQPRGRNPGIEWRGAAATDIIPSLQFSANERGLPMSEEPSFRDLIARVRAGDGQTVTELIRRYEPYLRAVLRVRLANTRLQRLLDSADICQSILHTFLVRATAGQFDLDTPEQLRQLLVTMALNKFRNYA